MSRLESLLHTWGGLSSLPFCANSGLKLLVHLFFHLLG